MSKAVRLGVWVLAVLVVVSAAVAVLTLMQKQTLEGQNQNLRARIADGQNRETELLAKAKKLQDDADQLNNKVSQADHEKTQTQGVYDELKRKSAELQSQIDQANTERDDYKNRVDTITRERDDLMQKLKDRPTQIVYKDRIVQAPAAVVSAPVVDVTSAQGDQYWASVLKQKAALQLELERAKSALDQVALQVAELKKQNSDLEMQVKQVTNEKDEIAQKVKYGGDLADTLSIDLARARNDQKAVNDRADKVKEENMDLQGQIKDLASTKISLEKTISRLTDDKNVMQKKLVETESVIQSRIDDIWKIKESLDKKLSDNPPSAPSAGGGMELPPIIVNAPNNQIQQGSGVPSIAVKNQGSIISINESSNFVITDLGQSNSTVSVGSALKVTRDSKEIAVLEVIQVRRDICAADIKNKSTELKVGDIVKLN
jgi:peptidoglycan hydrolase CwlO-like protein